MGVVICFTGFKSKEELHHLCCLAHLMGASIRKDMVSNVTHIVARAVNGSKYKVSLYSRTCMYYSHLSDWLLDLIIQVVPFGTQDIKFCTYSPGSLLSLLGIQGYLDVIIGQHGCVHHCDSPSL